MISVAILLAHTASTLTMFGLIWFVQLVHYPLLGACWSGVEMRSTGKHEYAFTTDT